MPKTYSIELKKQIITEVQQVKNVATIAKKHNIPISTIHSWLLKLKSKSLLTKKEIQQVINSDSVVAELKNLKKTLSEKDYEIYLLKELLKKTYQVWKTD
jgi:transposase-like protein